MKNKKRKSFYNNKHRNEKWTETPQGRKIDFADKYAYTDGYSDKYDETTRVAHQTAMRKKEKNNRNLRRFVALVLALVFIGVGYTAMDAHIIRYSKPAKAMLENKDNGYGTMSQLDINLNSIKIDSISLDNSSMLDSVIDDVRQAGYNSVTFDAKREDGTIGYKSQLATVDTYGALSSFGVEPKKSIKKLISNDILPVARICCYKDNVVPNVSPQTAVLKDGKLFFDEDKNTYLDPSNPANYDYLKDIVTELYGYGITVFVLTGFNLPEASGKSQDFASLARQLSESLHGEVKFVEEVDAYISGVDAESGDVTASAIVKQLKSLDKLSSGKVYYISSKLDDKKLMDGVKKSKLASYILA